jgi:NADPH:quinone reductase-like Zn-dependent oxidoreductase
VFGESIRGYQWTNGGAYAEYAAVREDGLAPKPANVTFEQAAAVPTSGLIALRGLRDEGGLTAGQRVLVNGAGGGVGGLAVQIAKAFGAEVTGVDGPGKLETVRSLGADRVLDYTREDFTRAGERYDLILDVPGNHSLSECLRALAPDGRYVLIGHDGFGDAAGRWLGSLPRFIGLMARSPFVRQLPRVRFSMPSKRESMAVLAELVEAGRLVPAIDRTYPLSEVREAIRHLESGTAGGKIVIAVAG